MLGRAAPRLPSAAADLLHQNISGFAKFSGAGISREIPLTVQRRVRLGSSAGHFRIVAMLEAVTAFFGIMSAGIFIAHAVDGYRSRL
jgi:hypothetical protein